MIELNYTRGYPLHLRQVQLDLWGVSIQGFPKSGP